MKAQSDLVSVHSFHFLECTFKSPQGDIFFSKIFTCGFHYVIRIRTRWPVGFLGLSIFKHVYATNCHRDGPINDSMSVSNHQRHVHFTFQISLIVRVLGYVLEKIAKIAFYRFRDSHVRNFLRREKNSVDIGGTCTETMERT